MGNDDGFGTDEIWFMCVELLWGERGGTGEMQKEEKKRGGEEGGSSVCVCVGCAVSTGSINWF